jgi:hypothetical protein
VLPCAGAGVGACAEGPTDAGAVVIRVREREEFLYGPLPVRCQDLGYCRDPRSCLTFPRPVGTPERRGGYLPVLPRRFRVWRRHASTRVAHSPAARRQRARRTRLCVDRRPMDQFT